MTFIQARFAPSPTGNMHLGNLYIVLFNFLLANDLKLRIEDTDKARSKKEYEENILFNLKNMNIEFSEIVYQSANIQNHLDVAYDLVRRGMAYKAKGEENDSIWIENQAYFDQNDVPYVIRLNVKNIIKTEKIHYYDENYGDLYYLTKDLDDQIIIRSDGTPTYNLCVVVDDHNMKITHIIRGNDHMTNTFKQVLIYHAMNWTPPIFVHLPLIESMNGGKLSKRKDDTGLDRFLDEGFLPIAIMNTMFLLGISSEKEILTIDEMRARADIKKISKSASKFNIDKMKFINAQHMKLLSADNLKTAMIQFCQRKNLNLQVLEIFNRTHMISDFLKRSATLQDLYNYMAVYFNESDEINKELLVNYNMAILPEILSILEDSTDMMSDMKNFAKSKNLPLIEVLMPLRILISNTNDFPHFFDIIEYWGKAKGMAIIQKRLLKNSIV